MTEDGWVTDPRALDTMAMLLTFQPGDQIRIRAEGESRAPFLYINKKYNGTSATVIDTGRTDSIGRPFGTTNQIVVSVVMMDTDHTSGWAICRNNIAAWRSGRNTL